MFPVVVTSPRCRRGLSRASRVRAPPARRSLRHIKGAFAGAPLIRSGGFGMLTAAAFSRNNTGMTLPRSSGEERLKPSSCASLSIRVRALGVKHQENSWSPFAPRITDFREVEFRIRERPFSCGEGY